MSHQSALPTQDQIGEVSPPLAAQIQTTAAILSRDGGQKEEEEILGHARQKRGRWNGDD